MVLLWAKFWPPSDSCDVVVLEVEKQTVFSDQSRGTRAVVVVVVLLA